MGWWRRRGPTVALVAGLVLVIGAVAWKAVAVPALLRFPLDLDVTVDFEGAVQLYVDPDTTEPLEEPRFVPLHVRRHLDAKGDQSSFDRVVVEETIQIEAPGIVDTTQRNSYVMDRRSMENVRDERSWAFHPDNVVDRSGTYRLNLPFDTDPNDRYTVYQNELDDTYQVRPSRQEPTLDADGVELAHFDVIPVRSAPLAPAYLEELRKELPFPDEVTLDELKPHLRAAGIDVDALLAVLLPVLTPEDLETLVGFAGKPISMSYVMNIDGDLGIETGLGALVDVRHVREMVRAVPDPVALPALLDLLARYPQVPEAVQAVEALDRLTAEPIPLFSYDYGMTDESVAENADLVKDQLRLKAIAEVWLPLVLAAVGVTLAVWGAVGIRRRRTEAADATGAAAATEPAGAAASP